MSIDLTPFMPVVQPLALAMATIALPVCSAILLRAVGLQATAARISFVESILLDAAHGMYLYFIKHEKPVTDKAAYAEAVAQAIDHVTAMVSAEVLAKQGIDTATIEAVIARKFGQVLASDPTITAAPSATVVPLESIQRPFTRAQ